MPGPIPRRDGYPPSLRSVLKHQDIAISPRHTHLEVPEIRPPEGTWYQRYPPQRGHGARDIHSHCRQNNWQTPVKALNTFHQLHWWVANKRMYSVYTRRVTQCQLWLYRRFIIWNILLNYVSSSSSERVCKKIYSPLSLLLGGGFTFWQHSLVSQYVNRLSKNNWVFPKCTKMAMFAVLYWLGSKEQINFSRKVPLVGIELRTFCDPFWCLNVILQWHPSAADLGLTIGEKVLVWRWEKCA